MRIITLLTTGSGLFKEYGFAGYGLRLIQNAARYTVSVKFDLNDPFTPAVDLLFNSTIRRQFKTLWIGGNVIAGTVQIEVYETPDEIVESLGPMIPPDYIVVQPSAPLPGAVMSYSIPSGNKKYELLFAEVTLTASGVAGSRYVWIRVYNAAGGIKMRSLNRSFTAGQSGNSMWGRGYSYVSGTCAPLPLDTVLESGDIIEFYVVGMDAGDALTAGQLSFKVWG